MKKMTVLSLKYLCVWVVLLTCSYAQNVSAADEVVAKVYDTKILAADLLPPEGWLEQAQAQGYTEEQIASVMEGGAYQKLVVTIMDVLSHKFLEEKGVTHTEKDIEAFVAFLESQKESNFKKMEADKVEFEKQLELIEDEEIKTGIQGQLDRINFYLENEARVVEAEAKDAQLLVQKEEELKKIALIATDAWYFQKTLYETYGGKVIRQPSGFEAIEGFEKFFKSEETKNNFQITEEKYADAFAKLDEYFNMEHDVVEEDVVKKYFEAPWWLNENVLTGELGF